MKDVATCAIERTVGVLTIDSPPVNALGIGVRRSLKAGLRRFLDDPVVTAIVLTCGGRTFFAGADIAEFDNPPITPTLYDILDEFENAAKPVVAALHGSALGGGFELALVCHHRIAVPSAKIGFPEVKLGLLPGGGGTQRLPRIVGVEAALDLISTGRSVGAREALALGLIDALAGENSLREDAIALARTIADKPFARVQDRDEKLASARGKPEIFARFRAERAAGLQAHQAIVEAIEATVALSFDRGLDLERELFARLRASTESKALRHGFFAEREAAKLADVPPSTPTRPIGCVGVVGAGTMGGGIAMTFLNAGVPVILAELNQ
jgi:3-hydroxyacyl-CoA dehydrogenase